MSRLAFPWLAGPRIPQVQTWLPTLLLTLCVAAPLQSAAQCVGDCHGDGAVTVDEIVTGVNIALGSAPVSNCPAFDADGSGEVTINELVRAVSFALDVCPAATTPTPRATPTPPGPSPTPYPGCGDGTVDVVAGEVCDDGNTVDTDACPATCRIAPCDASGSTVAVDVQVTAPAGSALAGATVFVRYPDAQVRLPGRANDASVQERILNLPDNAFSTPNDLDHALRIVILSPDASPFPAGRLFTAQFDRCADTPAPGSGDFVCIVEDAADTASNAVTGTTCEVVVR